MSNHEELFDIVSDIHLSHKNIWLPPENHKEGLILAGDIFEFDAQLEVGIRYLKLLSTFYKCIIYVPGNHEFYTKDEEKPIYFLELIIQERLKEDVLNVHLLLDDIFVYKNYTFVGSTYYTHIYHPNAICLNSDFYNIYTDFGLKLTIKSMNQLHEECKGKLLEKLKGIQDDTLVVVVTHFNPGITSSKKKHVDDEQWIAYDSLPIFETKLVNKWVFGHTHTYTRYKNEKYNIEFISNPKGYMSEKTGFKDNTCI